MLTSTPARIPPKISRKGEVQRIWHPRPFDRGRSDERKLNYRAEFKRQGDLNEPVFTVISPTSRCSSVGLQSPGFLLQTLNFWPSLVSQRFLHTSVRGFSLDFPVLLFQVQGIVEPSASSSFLEERKTPSLYSVGKH